MHYNKICMGPEIHFTPDMTCTLSKEVFMPITNKKPQLIHTVRYSLLVECCIVLHTATGAGILLVDATMTFAKQQYIVFVRDDTDLLKPFCDQDDFGPNQIYLHLEAKSNIKGPPSDWDILQVQQAFIKYIKIHMLYANVISTGDTHTSSVWYWQSGTYHEAEILSVLQASTYPLTRRGKSARTAESSCCFLEWTVQWLFGYTSSAVLP